MSALSLWPGGLKRPERRNAGYPGCSTVKQMRREDILQGSNVSNVIGGISGPINSSCGF